MYQFKPYNPSCGYTEKTHNLIEEMCRLVERDDYVLDKEQGAELVMQTYDLFNLPRPKKVVWCKDIFSKKYLDALDSAWSAGSARSARSAGSAWSARSAWSAWSAGSARSAGSAGSARSAWFARSAWSAWSAGSARSAWFAGSARSALDYDFDWFVIEHEYCEAPSDNPPNESDHQYLRYSELLLRAIECGVGYRVEFDEVLYLVPAPLVKIDSLNRFHNASGPAIHWKGGKELYRIHGIAFDTKQDLTNSLALSVKDTLAIENTDKRTVLMMEKSPDAIFDEMDCKLIDTAQVLRDNDTTLTYELYTVDGLTDTTEKMLRYKCASFERTGKTYTKFVEPHYTSALEAISNSHNLTPELYRLVTQQG